MNLKTLLNEKNMSMYRLAQLSGVPKTTVIDICSEKRTSSLLGEISLRHAALLGN